MFNHSQNQNIDIKDIAIIKIFFANLSAFILGLGVYALGVNISQVLPIPPFLFTAIVGLISTYILSDKFAKPFVSQWIESEIKAYKDLIKKESVQSLQRQYFDLLYGLKKVYLNVKTLNIDDLIENDEYSISKLEIDEKIDASFKQEKIYDKAWKELLEAEEREDNGEIRDVIQEVVRTTVTKGLKINRQDTNYQLYAKPIRAYLRAWLVCSIKYRKCMPIEPILDSRDNVKTHKTAIRYIRNNILNSENRYQFIPSQESIDVIKEYLDKLLAMIQEKDK
ncbi:hypothetical protein [Pseudanabaena minima]|uniref:hypothetical protein n=1 Tax=Pseudanabaena minima TaxID=890415 RepID=UPI003DA8A05A